MSPIRTGSVQGSIFLTSYQTEAQRRADALSDDGEKLRHEDNLKAARDAFRQALVLVPNHARAVPALEAIEATTRARRAVLVELNRARCLDEDVLEEALALVRLDPAAHARPLWSSRRRARPAARRRRR